MKSNVARLVWLVGVSLSVVAKGADDEGFKPLLNGKDLSGWNTHGGCEHWQVRDKIIDYDGNCTGDSPNLTSEKSFKDFVLKLDWRLPGSDEKHMKSVPAILPNGTTPIGAFRRPRMITIDYAGQAGIGLRGDPKAHIHVWNHPIGSGIIEGYRTDTSLPIPVRQSATPSKNADKPVGKWNAFEITVKGDRVTVQLNGEVVIDNAQLAGMPERGPVMLMHYGDPNHPRRAQFRNIAIKELK